MKRIYLILLINLGIISCSLLSVPTPNIVLPPQSIKECKKPIQLAPVPNNMSIKIEGNKFDIDANGEKFIEDYVNMQMWIKENYY